MFSIEHKSDLACMFIKVAAIEAFPKTSQKVNNFLLTDQSNLLIFIIEKSDWSYELFEERFSNSQ